MINRRLLPLKAHYFFFLGAMSPIMPFVMVIVKQLGVPVVVQGTIGFAALILTIFVKPLIGLAFDAIPKFRKLMFICLLMITYVGFCSIAVLPPMNSQEEPIVMGLMNDLDVAPVKESHETLPLNLISSVPDNGCYISEAWDCVTPCVGLEGNATSMRISHIMLKQQNPVLNTELENITERILAYDINVYREDFKCFSPNEEVKITCKGSNFQGSGCSPLFGDGVFWTYLILFCLSSITFTASNSITDAVCIDTVGGNGNYGKQRTWGTVGWGLMGPVGGLLVDWWSRGTYGKDYTPIMILVASLGVIDLLITIIKLKVPKIEKSPNVFKEVRKLMTQPHFLIFLFFAVLNGSFDGIVIQYVFILQEEMSKGTAYMDYIKFIQGLTLFVQCAVEAPFMFVCAWFVKKIGASGVTKLVFFLYIFRLFGLALVGSYGPVWATLVTEILNGPCYGLGYTAIVVQAGAMTPPGTSASVQSIVNICYESLGYALCSLFGGIIKTYLGSAGIYYVFGIISVITFILYLIADIYLAKVRHKYAPTPQSDPTPITEEASPLNEKPNGAVDFPIPDGLKPVPDEHLA